MTDRIYWRCFHCGDTFTKAQERWAREHFGYDQDAQPVCLIRTMGESALLTSLRKREAELVAYRSEDQDLLRSMHAMQADYASAIRNAEEKGYNKGVTDARTEDSGARSEAAIAIGEHAFRAGIDAAYIAIHGKTVCEEFKARAWSDYDPPEDIKALS